MDRMTFLTLSILSIGHWQTHTGVRADLGMR